MTRLTPEREDAIREYARNTPWDGIVQNPLNDLLEEIDALRKDLCTAIDEWHATLNLVDVRVKDERDTLRERIEALRKAHEYIADRVHVKDLDASVTSRKVLAKDNEKAGK